MFELKLPKMQRYEKMAAEFESQPIEKGKILFYGSSGFTRWTPKYNHRPLEEDIRMKDGSPAAINHGFGGSTIDEGLYYYHRMVKPWEPRAIVLRFFPNDISMGYSPVEIVYLIAQFCNWARADFPGVKLYLCDAMPHKRFISSKMWQRLATQYNKLLKDYCDENEDCTYVSQSAWPGFYEDPADAGDYSKVRQDIWVEDQMHLTQEGYDIYRDLFLNALDDIL
jgi:lysophospholipase L1-like esterase